MSIHRTILGAGLTCLAAFTVGCSELPSAPLPAGGELAGTATLRTDDPGSDAPPAPMPSPAPAPGSGPAVPAGGFSASRSMQGSAGGSLRAGRFTLVIPAGALSGSPVITLSQPDSTRLRCVFTISPPLTKALSVPMTLVADASQLQSRTLTHSSLAAFNIATGRYTNMPGSSVNMRTRSISAPARTFATCQVQKTSGQ